MPQKSDIILSILSASVFVLLIVIAGFLLFRIYLKKKNILLLEKERIRLAYEQTLMRSRLEMQEQAFTQISHEIHDNIGQVLSLVRLNINTIGLPEERIAATDALLERAITDLRGLSHRLNTNYIREIGLTAAIQQLLGNLANTRQFKTSLDGLTVDTSFNEEKSIILFRIVQEVINNIIKHAKATAIHVGITTTPGGFQLTIIDNGIGFDTTLIEQPNGLGIHNMQERAKIIDAELCIESQPGKGTTVIIKAKT
jgi:signal transduction histidine kinase